MSWDGYTYEYDPRVYEPKDPEDTDQVVEARRMNSEVSKKNASSSMEMDFIRAANAPTATQLVTRARVASAAKNGDFTEVIESVRPITDTLRGVRKEGDGGQA